MSCKCESSNAQLNSLGMMWCQTDILILRVFPYSRTGQGTGSECTGVPGMVPWQLGDCCAIRWGQRILLSPLCNISSLTGFLAMMFLLWCAVRPHDMSQPMRTETQFCCYRQRQCWLFCSTGHLMLSHNNCQSIWNKRLGTSICSTTFWQKLRNLHYVYSQPFTSCANYLNGRQAHTDPQRASF